MSAGNITAWITLEAWWECWPVELALLADAEPLVMPSGNMDAL